MRALFLLGLMMIQSTYAVEGFQFRSEDSICGLMASGQQNADLEEAFQDLADDECTAQGFEAALLSDVSFRVLPFSWETIGCTPISHHIISGNKQCF